LVMEDVWGSPREIAQKMAAVNKESLARAISALANDPNTTQILVDGRYWNQVVKELPPVVAKWVLENKGSSEKKYIQANSVVTLCSDHVKFGFFALQMTRSASHGYIASWGSIDSRVACSSIEKAILSVAIERGLLPDYIQYCGSRLVDEQTNSKNLSGNCAHGFVYFVRNSDIYKIGITENLLRRFSELKPDEVLNVIRCANYRDLERKLHAHFRDDRIPQTEYFRLDNEKVIEVNRLFSEWVEY